MPANEDTGQEADGDVKRSDKERAPIWCRAEQTQAGGKMNAIKFAAIVLIAAGILGWAYGSFSYTKETHEAQIGLFELSLKDKLTVDVPVWTDMGVVAIGGVLLVLGGWKSSRNF